MAFTSSDLTAVETAIKDLAIGKRAVTFTLLDRVVRYAEAQLPDLLKLRDQIKEELGAAETDVTKRRPRVYRARHSKGL